MGIDFFLRFEWVLVGEGRVGDIDNKDDILQWKGREGKACFVVWVSFSQNFVA